MGDRFAHASWGFNGPPSYPNRSSSGNIDLARRPLVHHPDGSYGTLYSYTLDENGQHVLVPGITQTGQTMNSEQQARDYYKKTGQYLGKFDEGNSYNNSDRYADLLHKQQMDYQSSQNGGEYSPTAERWEPGAQPITDALQQQRFVDKFAYFPRAK